ncbi:uncharacterized protein [Procambarus clarkii]|uniref:uncharacterized protein n=1 Tax=Procambarus clarkii TaxID=6728 RepID=UPI003743A393
MASYLKLTLLAVALSSVVTSQPFSQSEASRHSGFQWNSRKLGSRKVATISIRKDEERDRRSIPLAGDDDTISTTLPRHQRASSSAGHQSRRRHTHRHHHGADEGVWLADEGLEGGNHDVGRGLSPSYLPESGLQETRLERLGLNDERHAHGGDVRHAHGGDVRHAHDGDIRHAHEGDMGHFPRFQEILDSAGIHLDPSLLRNLTSLNRLKRNRNEGQKRGGDRKKPKKPKKNKKPNKQKRGKNKGSKGCRRLKGRKKKQCRSAFKRCKTLRGKEKKACQAEASRAFLDDSGSNDTVPEDDMFSFIKNITEMSGSDACQYHHLELCCRKVGLPSRNPKSLKPVVKCRFREDFLKCMEEQREGTCDPNFQTRGDLAALRNKISEVIWTTTSCLISEVVEG